MNRDQKIRMLTSRMSPAARAIAVENFCQNPYLLRDAFKSRLRTARNSQKKYVSFTMRLSGEDYKRLSDMAGEAGKSMTEFTKGRIGL